MLLPSNLMSLWLELIGGRKFRGSGMSVNLEDLKFDPKVDELDELQKLGYYRHVDEGSGFVMVPF